MGNHYIHVLDDLVKAWVAFGNHNGMLIESKGTDTFKNLPPGIQQGFYCLAKEEEVEFSYGKQYITSEVPFLVIHTKVCRIKTPDGYFTAERPLWFSISIREENPHAKPFIETPQFKCFPGEHERYINLLRLGEFMGKSIDETREIFKQCFELADTFKLFISYEGQCIRVLKIVANIDTGGVEALYVDQEMWVYNRGPAPGTENVIEGRHFYADRITPLERFYVPADWAMNVLYLNSFGYKPRI